MRAAALRAPARRLGVLCAVWAAAFLLLSVRAVQLGVAPDSRIRERVDRQLIATSVLPPERGAIVDRNGVELAVASSAPSVYATPAALPTDPAALQQLARTLGRGVEELRRRLDGREHFTYLVRWVDRNVADAVLALELPGVGVLAEPARAHPLGELGASLVGVTNIDNEGVRGVERSEDAWLRSEPRRVVVERDARGRLLTHAGVSPDATAGGDVRLAVDVRMQAVAERALRDALAHTGALGGSVITLDPQRGDVLALAEAPGFHPDHFRQLSVERTRSPALEDALEPGSTMKAFLVAAALEADAVDAQTAIDTEGGRLVVSSKSIHDHRDYGTLTPESVLTYSSNVGAVRIAERLGPAAHWAALRRFGFGRSTGSGLPSESDGLLRGHESWRPLDRAAVAFGQGLNVTPMQLAAATAVLANGGEWVRPRIVEARRPHGGEWVPTPVLRERRVISEDTAHAVLKMLESVVSEQGTGGAAALEGVRVAGKTGTAQKLDPETRGYSSSAYWSWFFGIVPADAPRLVVVCMLDEPVRPLHTGGAAAAPLFAEVAAGQLGVLGIRTGPTRTAPSLQTPAPVQLVRRPTPRVERDSSPATPAAPDPTPATARRVAIAKPMRAAAPTAVATTASGSATPPVARTAPEIVRLGDHLLLPDLRGLDRKTVMRITSENSLELQLVGSSGRVIEQDPEPGAILERGKRRVWVRLALAFQGDD